MDDAVSAIELPLFPLNTVLFPGQILPLHIFEDRYRLMIRRCLADDTPFGVALIRQGREVGETATPHPVGTVARIIESAYLPDGNMNIITVGVERFRIVRLLYDQPYLRGRVEPLPLIEADKPSADSSLVRRVRDLTIRYVELIAQAAGLQIQLDQVPDVPLQIGYLAAVAMQIDNREKQALLSATSLKEILSLELTLLNRENALLTWIARRKDWPEQRQFGPSGTLLPN